MNIKQTAQLILKKGISVIPIDQKIPSITWGEYQSNYISETYLNNYLDICTGIGIVTGELSGLVVVDCDHDLAIEKAKSLLPDTPIKVKTGKGLHLYYRYPQDKKISNKQGKKGLGIDVRAEGGYVVAPPSLHPSGKQYELIGSWDDIENLPVYDEAWLESIFPKVSIQPTTPKTPTNVPLTDKQEKFKNWIDTKEGTQVGANANRLSFNIAWTAIHGFDLTPDEAIDIFLEWGEQPTNLDATGNPYPWTRWELYAKLKKAMEYGSHLEHGFMMLSNNNSFPTQEQLELAMIAKNDKISVHKPKSRYYTHDDFMLLPPSKQIIAKHLIEKSLCVIYGPSGSGKTLYALSLCYACVLDRPLFNTFKTRKSTVLYMASEAGGTLAYRLQAFKKHLGINHRLETFLFGTDSHNFQNQDETLATIRERLNQDSYPIPSIIVIDTLACNMKGNENDKEAMGAITDTCKAIIAEFGCSVILIHHTGKDEGRGMRGSSSLAAACDSIIRVSGGMRDPNVLISCDKLKDGKPFDDYYLSKTEIPIDAEDFDSSVVLSYVTETQEDRKQVFLDLFDCEQPRTLSDIYVVNHDLLVSIGINSLKTIKNKANNFVKEGLLKYDIDPNTKHYKYNKVNKG